MKSFKGNDIISTEFMTKEEIEKILDVAASMNRILKMKTKAKLLEDKILAVMFFQTSTRTRLSFESAMLRLGGSVLGFADAKVSRAAGPRAETLEDTVRTVNKYCDAIVIRHPESGAAQKAADYSRVPVLNGGDGQNQHPSQGLLDALTIWSEKGTLDGLTVGIVGDMKETRGMHSLMHCLAKFNLKLLLAGPKEISPEPAMIRFLEDSACSFEVTEDVEGSIPEMDVLYTTRLNKEGADSEESYQELLQRYPRIDLQLLKNAKPDCIVMHDLPRTDELGLQILPEVDDTPHGKYFDEVEYGVAVRMAMLALVLGGVE